MAAVLSESAACDSILVNDVTQERESALTECAHLWIQRSSSTLNTLESCCEPGVVLRLIPAKDHNIVHLTDDPLQTAEVCGHPFLKVFMGTRDTKW